MLTCVNVLGSYVIALIELYKSTLGGYGARMALRGESPHVDQVVRRLDYLNAHPGVTVEHRERPVSHWEARWTEGGRDRTVVHHELKGILDKLDELLP